MHDTEEASNDGRVRVHIIHGLNISHKELTYLLQKSISYQNEVLRACSQGIDWQEKTIARPRLPLIRMTIKEHLMFQICYTTVTIRACQGLANLNTIISQIHNYSTSSTLILPSSYLKTIIKYQTSHSIQCILYESFYYIPLGCPSYQDQFHNQSKLPCYSKDSQNNISEAREFIYFFKIKLPPCSKRYK